MFSCILLAVFAISHVSAFPDPGQWSGSYTNVPLALFGIAKPLYANSSIFISVNCESSSSHQKIELQWVLRQTSCFEDSIATDIYNLQVLYEYFICPMSTNYSPQIRFFISKPLVLDCSNRIHLEYVNATFVTYSDKIEIPTFCQNTLNLPTSQYYKQRNMSLIDQAQNLVQSNITFVHHRRNAYADNVSVEKHTMEALTQVFSKELKNGKKNTENKDNEVNYAVHHSNLTFPNQIYGHVSGPFTSKTSVKGSKLATVDMDGIFLFILKIRSIDESKVNVSVDVSMQGNQGYLSAVDYPLLLFYGIMCGVYVIYAVVWLIMSALQWRDLLRIQFWIGAVILLGLMEKAVFYAEYQSINFTGHSVKGAILFAEILSCMKRTLARMLIIIVSLGFGIVKPRLGPTLHRIIGVGVLYFCLGTIEGCLRVLKPKTDPGNQALMAGIPLAVTDSAICWWIFSSLVQTIRTLRLRRNIVKLQLYRHFTNTLILAVLGSVGFMSWSIHAHKLVNCIVDWKELWVDEAYWHFLFSIILFVIMVLWRPTNNNQRYAFTPLLDAIDDDEDDEDDNHVANDIFDGMKMRATKNNVSFSPKEDGKAKQDEDLKWVEENIPTSLTDVALPTLLDSEEEIETTKFERSKME